MVDSNAGFRTRLAAMADIDEILAIEGECFAPGIRETAETFEDRIKAFPSGFIMLDRGAEKAGYFCSELWDSIPSALPERWALGHKASERHVARGSVLYVSSFAVRPTYRGGTGTAFFAEAIASVVSRNPGIRDIAFIVNEEWTAARRIYEHAGFDYIGTLPGFFPAANAPDAADARAAALIMTKNIQEGTECA